MDKPVNTKQNRAIWVLPIEVDRNSETQNTSSFRGNSQKYVTVFMKRSTKARLSLAEEGKEAQCERTLSGITNAQVLIVEHRFRQQ